MTSSSLKSTPRGVSPWAGTRALHSLTGPASAPSSALQNVGNFLRRRCGTLEEAFSALDSTGAGFLTLESFARGMEKLGFESPLAETTRVFQAMDNTAMGSVGLPRFLGVFADLPAEPRLSDVSLSIHSTRSVAPVAATTGPDSAGGVSIKAVSSEAGIVTSSLDTASSGEANVAIKAKKGSEDLDFEKAIEKTLQPLMEKTRAVSEEVVNAKVRAISEDMTHKARIISSELINTKMECEMNVVHQQFEARINTEVSRLREFIGDMERRHLAQVELLEAKTLDAERANKRQTDIVEAKLMDAFSSANEELKTRIESMRQQLENRLRDTELAHAQLQLDLKGVVSIVDGNVLETRGQLDAVREHVASQQDSVKVDVMATVETLRTSLESSLQAFRTEMHTALQEERAISTEQTKSVGRALSEEFERNILAQATASARTEACSVTCSVVSKEFEAWQKHQGSSNMQSEIDVRKEIAHVEERLSMTELRLKDLQALEPGTLEHRLSITENRLKDLQVLDLQVSDKASTLEERLSITENRLKDLQVIEACKAVAEETSSFDDALKSSFKVDAGPEKPPEKPAEKPPEMPPDKTSEKPASQEAILPERLEGTLQAILQKLDERTQASGQSLNADSSGHLDISGRQIELSGRSVQSETAPRPDRAQSVPVESSVMNAAVLSAFVGRAATTNSKGPLGIGGEEQRLEATLQNIIAKLDRLGQSDRSLVLEDALQGEPLGGQRLEGTLQTIIDKLDTKCIDGLVPDLKQLSQLLSANPPASLDGRDGEVRDLQGVVLDKLQAFPSTGTGDEAQKRSASASCIHRSGSPDSSGPGSSAQGGELQKLRDDVLGYLRSDFHNLVSTTLKGLQTREEAAAGASAVLQAANEAPPSVSPRRQFPPDGASQVPSRGNARSPGRLDGRSTSTNLRVRPTPGPVDSALRPLTSRSTDQFSGQRSPRQMAVGSQQGKGGGSSQLPSRRPAGGLHSSATEGGLPVTLQQQLSSASRVSMGGSVSGPSGTPRLQVGGSHSMPRGGMNLSATQPVTPIKVPSNAQPRESSAPHGSSLPPNHRSGSAAPASERAPSQPNTQGVPAASPSSGTLTYRY